MQTATVGNPHPCPQEPKTVHVCAHVETDIRAEQARLADSQHVHSKAENNVIMVGIQQGETAQFCLK